jgi:hypothetical protein
MAEQTGAGATAARAEKVSLSFSLGSVLSRRTPTGWVNLGVYGATRYSNPSGYILG